MQHEASNEFNGVELHGFMLIIPFSPVVLLSKGHLFVVYLPQSTVRDGDSMGITR
jgi:hypothetical protein